MNYVSQKNSDYVIPNIPPGENTVYYIQMYTYICMHMYCLRVHTHMVLYNSLRIYSVHVPFSPYNVHALIRDEKELRKKEASKVKQTTRQSNTAPHPRYNVVTSLKKMYMHVHVFKREMRRKKERSKQGQINMYMSILNTHSAQLEVFQEKVVYPAYTILQYTCTCTYM